MSARAESPDSRHRQDTGEAVGRRPSPGLAPKSDMADVCRRLDASRAISPVPASRTRTPPQISKSRANRGRAWDGHDAFWRLRLCMHVQVQRRVGQTGSPGHRLTGRPGSEARQGQPGGGRIRDILEGKAARAASAASWAVPREHASTILLCGVNVRGLSRFGGRLRPDKGGRSFERQRRISGDASAGPRCDALPKQPTNSDLQASAPPDPQASGKDDHSSGRYRVCA